MAGHSVIAPSPSPSPDQAFAAAAVAVARKRLRKLAPDARPLQGPALRALAYNAIAGARGPAVTAATPVHFTVWRGGAHHVGKSSPGVSLDATLPSLADALRERARVVADKGAGWVVEPTVNADGRRTNASTLAMTALFLDADNTGPWDALLGALRDLGLAHLAYQSGGYAPAAPKWRVVVPLAAPLPVEGEEGRALWRATYLACRVVFGALAGLAREGFDARTDGVAIPWFCTERRRAGDPEREVVLQLGASLDLVRLTLALPPAPEAATPPREGRRAPSERATEDADKLSEERAEEVVRALAEAAADVPTGRRDLYLALPGALLDRGLDPDDAVDICAEVSARYPRPDDKRHADNVRAAKCTVAKWRAGEVYTRIGTLQEQHPQVAAALDRVLPDEAAEELLAVIRRGVSAPPPPSTPSPPATSPPPPPRHPHARVTALHRRLAKLAVDKQGEGSNAQTKLSATALTLILDGRSAEVPQKLVDRAFALVGFEIPDVDVDAVIVALRECAHFDAPGDALVACGAALLGGQARRRQWDALEPAREEKSRSEREEKIAARWRSLDPAVK